jgi:hypothetical protein
MNGTHVFLERQFEPPIGGGDVLALAEAAASCLQMHRVGWNGSFLGSDGRLMLCWFTAADAESARIALRQVRADTRRLWPGTVHEGPVPAVPNVIVERGFGEPVTIEEIQAIEDAGAWCLEAHNVTFARTFFSGDRKRMLCLYEAPDAESVRLAQREAAMPMERVWAFRRYGIEDMTAGTP